MKTKDKTDKNLTEAPSSTNFIKQIIEADLKAHYAYTSIRFHGDRALLTYYVARGGLLSLKFKSIPLAWFRE